MRRILYCSVNNSAIFSRDQQLYNSLEHMSMHNVAYLSLILLNKYGNMFNKLFLAYASIVIKNIWGLKFLITYPFIHTMKISEDGSLPYFQQQG